MDLETTSRRIFGSPNFIEVASIVAKVNQAFTVTEMTTWSRASHSSIDRTVKRMENAGLLVSVETLYSKSPQVPEVFWKGLLALRTALEAVDSQDTKVDSKTRRT
jgi:DNA-binding PadR family transcriptional regulator